VPTKEEHKAKAVHNETFVATLKDPYWDWAVTGMFYAAVHYVMAYLATQGIHPVLHHVRNSHIHRDPKLNSIYIDYRELQNNSEDARYMERVPATAFTQQDVTRLTVCLNKIKQIILPLI
jgi:type IV secretory pathway VirB3-like protein